MKKGRKPLEFLDGERIYYVNKAKNGRGDVYGVVYLPEKYINKKVKVELIKLKKGQKIEIIKREYSNRNERRLKK